MKKIIEKLGDRMGNNNELSTLMLLASFMSLLCSYVTYPHLIIEIMKQISNIHISMESIVIAVGVITANYLWNKYGNRIFKYYNIICIVDTILYIICIFITICSLDLVLYYVSSFIIVSTTSKHIGCGKVKLRAKIHPIDAERERFDNNDDSVSYLAVLVGNAIAMLINLDIRILLVINLIGCIIDNIIYIYI